MTTNNTFTVSSSDTIDLSGLHVDSNNTMYYTTPQGTISTVTIPQSSTTYNTYNTLDSLSYHDYFKHMREFIDTMPALTKVEEMCTMYPALDKAFENFKAIYDLVKDDYEARKNGNP